MHVLDGQGFRGIKRNNTQIILKGDFGFLASHGQIIARKHLFGKPARVIDDGF